MAGLNGVGHKCNFYERLQDATSQIDGKVLILIDVDGSEIDIISRLASSMNSNILNNAKIIVETDFRSDRLKSNKLEIIEALDKIGFTPIKEVLQDPTLRISKASMKYTQSFLGLVIQGMEGRRLNQSWLLFKKGNRARDKGQEVI